MTDPAATPAVPRRKLKPGVVAAVAVLVIAFGWLIYGGIDKNVVYFLTPTELLERGAAGVDAPVRLGGQVKPGSVKWDEATRNLEFEVIDTGGASAIRVASKGVPPQMFRDGMGVVIEGRLGSDHVFKSTNLMIKHSNEYRPPANGQGVQEMYKSLIKGNGA
jgi:cytochrome c-type biogenesis protein CcmE